MPAVRRIATKENNVSFFFFILQCPAQCCKSSFYFSARVEGRCHFSVAITLHSIYLIMTGKAKMSFIACLNKAPAHTFLDSRPLLSTYGSLLGHDAECQCNSDVAPSACKCLWKVTTSDEQVELCNVQCSHKWMNADSRLMRAIYHFILIFIF